MSEKALDLSICIVSWNTLDILKNCIESIYRYVRDYSFEIIVVDNASGDGTQQALRKEYPLVLLIENDKNFGFGRANNQAISISRGQYILLLNPDIILQGGISDLIHPISIDPLVGCVGGRLIEPDGKIQESCYETFPTPWSEFLEGMMLDRLLERISGRNSIHKTCNDVEEVAWLVGACMVFRREVLMDLAGFEDRYYIYGEDVDLCYRLKKRGYKILYVRSVEMLHYHGASAQKTDQKYFSSVMQRESMFRFMTHHYGVLNGYFYRMAWMFSAIFRISVLVFLYGISSIVNNDRKERYLSPLKKYLKIFNWGLGFERWAKVPTLDRPTA